MKPGRMAAWAVTATALPVLAACGGGSGGGSTPANQPTSAAPHASSSAPQSPAAPSSSAAGNGGATTASKLTPPGTHLGLGQQAIVGWDPGDTGKNVFKLELTVVSIEKGSIANDFRNVQLNAKEKASTPYYVTVKIKALSSNPPSDNDDPAIALNGIDDRGQQQGEVTFFGHFARCDDPQAPRPFTAGKSFTACLTYLMPGGGSIKSMTWTEGPHKTNDVTPYFEKPVVWAG
jgi:hypothetical protein